MIIVPVWGPGCLVSVNFDTAGFGEQVRGLRFDLAVRKSCKQMAVGLPVGCVLLKAARIYPKCIPSSSSERPPLVPCGSQGQAETKTVQAGTKRKTMGSHATADVQHPDEASGTL